MLLNNFGLHKNKNVTKKPQVNLQKGGHSCGQALCKFTHELNALEWFNLIMIAWLPEVSTLPNQGTDFLAGRQKLKHLISCQFHAFTHHLTLLLTTSALSSNLSIPMVKWSLLGTWNILGSMPLHCRKVNTRAICKQACSGGLHNQKARGQNLYMLPPFFLKGSIFNMRWSYADK